MNIYEKHFKADLFDDYRITGEGNKLRTYRLFKNTIYPEQYLSNIKDREIRKYFCRLRVSAHNLPIETGRHRRPKVLPVCERVCDMCNCGEIGNEYHIMIDCKSLDQERKLLFKSINNYIHNFENLTSEDKFICIMQCHTPDMALHLTLFLKELVSKRGKL